MPTTVMNATALARGRLHLVTRGRLRRRRRTIGVLVMHPVTLCGAGKHSRSTVWAWMPTQLVNCPHCTRRPVVVVDDHIPSALARSMGVELAEEA